MEKQQKRLAFGITRMVSLLFFSLLFLDLFRRNRIIPFDQWIQYFSSGQNCNNKTVGRHEESMDFLLSRVVTGEDRKKLQATGFACHATNFSVHCVTNQPVTIETGKMTVHIPSNQPLQEIVVRPYARQEDRNLLKNVTPVKILKGNSTAPLVACQYIHDVPAVIFSSSGFVGNVFHKFNEVIIPLFITTRHFGSRVRFILEDYKASFVMFNKS